MSDDLEATCASFLFHWKALRGDALVPTIEAFLDRPSPAHAPWLFMAEIRGDDLLIRLEGTGLVTRWGRDLTGDKLFRDRSPDYVRKVAENYRTVLEHPCGYYALNQYLSGRGRNVRVRVLYLPLMPKPGRQPRIVGYSVELQRRPFDDESLLASRTTVEAEWIDIGAGVPASAPNRPSG
jgi:hypothetical protein